MISDHILPIFQRITSYIITLLVTADHAISLADETGIRKHTPRIPFRRNIVSVKTSLHGNKEEDNTWNRNRNSRHA